MSIAPVVHRPGQRLGRFRLLAELGRGAQAVVWRARDERLDREVALKLMLSHADALPVDTWLHEAKAVGRLAHPHIVPVFEADQIDGQPCLVFELVTGRTLAEVLRRSGAMPAREAVDLMLGVVDALRAAHAQDIVHRDLKPSNILIDDEGRARVMDFGIAARLAGPDDGTAGCIVGSPGYLSPEAAAGAAPSPQMDVFAAGLVLGELLAGAPLLAERVPLAAVRRVQQEDLQLPAGAAVDDRLRAVVQRAIARDPACRYDSAASLRDALMQWLAPADETPADPHGTGHRSGHGTLDFLLRRMRHKSDFPALTDHVVRIQRMASSDSENLNHLADEILKDVALTHKLLRLVNTVNFRRNGHGVSTISRAVALVGLAGIRNLALSLVLVEHMKDKGHAQRLKEEFLRALMAARLAHALSSTEREAEEAFLGAMFHNLGRLLTEYYFPDEAEAIRAQLRLAGARGEPRLSPEQAADRAAAMVLGLGYEALGIGVARHWGLPESLQRSMRRPDNAPSSHALSAGPERQRWLALAANELAELLWQGDGDELPARLEALADRHGRALGLTLPDLRRAADSARQALSQMAPTMGLVLPQGTRGQRLIADRSGAPDPTDSLAPHQLAALSTLRSDAAGADAPTLRLSPHPLADPAAAAAAVAVTDLLAAGIQDITDTLAGDTFRLNEVLRMVLETMYRALGFQRIVFCLRDPATGRLNGRFGLGEGARVLSPLFQVALRWPVGQAPDLFAAVCLKGSDTLISDSRQPAIAQRLPAWYRQRVDAPSFLLLPMVMKGAPFALIYADQSHPGGLALGDRELALVRTLRNQAVMAFRQCSHAG